jgi:hypothetical protein
MTCFLSPWARAALAKSATNARSETNRSLICFS